MMLAHREKFRKKQVTASPLKLITLPPYRSTCAINAS